MVELLLHTRRITGSKPESDFFFFSFFFFFFFLFLPMAICHVFFFTSIMIYFYISASVVTERRKVLRLINLKYVQSSKI